MLQLQLVVSKSGSPQTVWQVHNDWNYTFEIRPEDWESFMGGKGRILEGSEILQPMMHLFSLEKYQEVQYI